MRVGVVPANLEAADWLERGFTITIWKKSLHLAANARLFRIGR
jgi:hypothetical protein